MSEEPPHVPGWRSCPFEQGRRYRVTKSVRSLRDAFDAGEVVTFLRAGYSVYHSITGYFFTGPGGAIKALDVGDQVEGDEWYSMFEPIA